MESFGTAWVRVCSASCAIRWASVRLVAGSMSSSASAWSRCPIHRILTLRTAADTGFGGQRGFGGVDELGVDAVHEAAEHVADGGAQHGQDGDRDEQPDDGVGEREAKRDTASTEQHGQRGEAVGAGVQAVGDQGGRADLAADADAVDRDEFVADEPDEPGRGDPADVLDRDGVDEPAHRLDARRSPRTG